jgi:hypothetical protein
MTAAGMTADVLQSRSAERALPVPVVLGLQEGRRIVLHPLTLLGLVLTCVILVTEGRTGAREAFETVSTAPTWFMGVLGYFAAHLVASRDRRSHSGEWLAVVPASGVQRVAGLCLAALAPTMITVVFVAAMHQVNQLQDLYVVPPNFWHLAQAPLSVFGGALLGIMVARWTRVPGVPLLVMIAMVLVNAWLNSKPDTLQPLATYVPWAVWTPVNTRTWHGFNPGSPAWHVAYLAALCAMAATGAFLRESPNRARVLGVGACFTAAAVVTGFLQLP